MTFKRLLMPMIILGIVLSIGSMAFAQSTVTCGMTNATGASIGPIPAVSGGTDIPKTDISGNVAAGAPPIPGFPGLQGASGHAASTGHTVVQSAGSTSVPPTAGGAALRIFCYNPGPTVTPGVIVLTVSFPVPITNTTAFPSNAIIKVANGTLIPPASGGGANAIPGTGATTCAPTPGNGGFLTGTGACANVGISSMTNGPTGSIVLGIGTPVTTTTANPTAGVPFPTGAVLTFDLDGILLGVNGKSGEVDATLTEVSGAVNLTSQVVPVITNVTGPIQDPTVLTGAVPTLVASQNTVGGVAPSSGPAVLNSNGTALKGNFTVRIQENFPEMWQSAQQYNGGGVFPVSPASNTQVNLIFKSVPSGLNISGCVASVTDTTGTTTLASGQPTISSSSVTAASNILTVSFINNMDLINTDVLWVTCSSVGQGSATLPLPSTPVTVQAEMGPLGAPLGGIGNTSALTGLATGLIPRYQDAPQPAAGVTVITFPPSQTSLLVTYAVVVPGFNTGIAISNTTTDPFGASGGGATPTDGTITFTMFKNDGTSKAFTTATVKSGTTYAANLSDILSSAGFGASFTGYIFAQANFSFAHGAATIYDTATGHAALSTPVLVVEAANQNITSANPRNPPEALAQ